MEIVVGTKGLEQRGMLPCIISYVTPPNFPDVLFLLHVTREVAQEICLLPT